MITMSVGEEFQLRLFFGCSFTLLLFSITSISLTEQTDSDVWGRPPIAHVNGGYEGVIVAIHKNVPQERLLLDKTKEVIKKASQNLYDATKKFFRDVVILIPSSWNIASYMTSNETKFAAAGDDYERSHIRIRTSYEIVAEDNGDSSFSSSSYSNDLSVSCSDNIVVHRGGGVSEPFVHQPGKCGEESVFIGVTPRVIEDRDDIWGDPAKVLVHLWGHFRWGLFDEYLHSPFNCTALKDNQNNSRCSREIKNVYKRETSGDSNAYEDATLKNVCSNFVIGLGVHTVIPEYINGSIMSVSSNEMIDEFCHNSPNKSSSFKHNGDAFNRHNQMCQRKSSWEVMEQHSDFANDSTTMFEEPNFILMIRKIIRKLVLTERTDTISQSCGTLPYSNDCYILRSLALSDSSGKIGIAENENNYTMMDAEFEMKGDVKSLTDPSVEISEVIVLENASGSLINRFFNSNTKINFTKCTVFGDDFNTYPQLHQCQYSTVSEYLENIHYDDVEEFVRVLSKEGTINETSYSQELGFTLDCGIEKKYTILLLRWDNGNMAIRGSSLQSVYISETLVEKRIGENSFSDGVLDNVPFTLEKTGPETVRFRLEVFSKASVTDYDVEPVRVRPYLKSSSVVSDCSSAITIYTSVTQNDKPILGAKVVAKVSSSAGSSVDLALTDSNFYEDFEDGIYSANFSPFNGSDNYTIDVKAKGEAGHTTWNVEGLQPSGVLPDKISVRKLLSEPVILEKNFERSPRSISLEVHCQGPSTMLYTTPVDTPFLDETSQTTRIISEDFTTFLEKETDIPTTVLVPDETATFDSQTSKVPSSQSETTVLSGIMQTTTELSTSEDLTTFGEKSTLASTTVLSSDETTTPFDTTFDLQTTIVSSSEQSETTLINGVMRTTELSSSDDLTTSGETSTGASTNMLSSDKTTSPFDTTFNLESTKVPSPAQIETTFLNGIMRTTEHSTSEELTTAGEMSAGSSTNMLSSDETTTPLETTFDLHSTKVPSPAQIETTFLNGIMRTTEHSTSEELTTSGETSAGSSTNMLSSDETTTPLETTFDLHSTKEVPSSAQIETTVLNGIMRTTELSTSKDLTSSAEKRTGASTNMLSTADTTTPFATTFNLQSTKVSSSEQSETTFLNGIMRTTELSTSDDLTTPGETGTGASTNMLSSDETTTPFDTTFDLQTTKELSTELSSIHPGLTTFEGTRSQSTERVEVGEVTFSPEMTTGEPTSVLRQDDTITPPVTTVDKSTTTAVVTTDAHTTDFDGTTKEISKCTTSDAQTTPSEMTPYSSLEILATDAMSSTPQKLDQLSTTTAGKIPLMTSTTEGSSPPSNKGSICPDDKRWICIFVPTVAATIFLFAISYLIVDMQKSKRMLRYSVEDREKERLGFRTNEKAPRHALKDIEMQCNSVDH